MLRIMVDLPIVIEFFDTAEVVNSALDLIGDLIPAGHILSWSATCR
jgi:PII-like signaling protein